VNALLGADVYTLHAGTRAAGSLTSVRAAVLALEERLGIPVGVEAMYPDPKQTWLLSSWDEHRWLLESDICYALDLSHLNILARRSRWTDYGLTAALLTDPRCIEIHVSDNDGHSDRHAPLTRQPWWWGCLEDAVKLNPGAVIFSEGNQLRRKPRP
jgi:sugar phosphate isomerase/epimerase